VPGGGVARRPGRRSRKCRAKYPGFDFVPRVIRDCVPGPALLAEATSESLRPFAPAPRSPPARHAPCHSPAIAGGLRYGSSNLNGHKGIGHACHSCHSGKPGLLLPLYLLFLSPYLISAIRYGSYGRNDTSRTAIGTSACHSEPFPLWQAMAGRGRRRPRRSRDEDRPAAGRLHPYLVAEAVGLEGVGGLLVEADALVEHAADRLASGGVGAADFADARADGQQLRAQVLD
jgi:hypothetical protein